MKQIYSLLLLLSCIISGNGQNKARSPKENISDTSIKASAKEYDPVADIVSSSLKDKSGNLWFAASGRGVYRYNGKTFTSFTVKDGLCNNEVSCLYEDKAGNIWFGTNNGVCNYNGKTFTNFPIDVADTSTIQTNRYSYSQSPKHVSSILQDKKGNFWFATLNHGVYCYNGNSFANFLSGEVLLSVLEDKNGSIWVSSWQHGGVYRYDPSAELSTGEKSFTRLDGLSDDMIFCMAEDKAGNIWIGTRDHGVDCYNGKSITNFSEKDGLCNDGVSCIFEDKHGNIWFGSDSWTWGSKRGDACCFNGKFFTNITAKESFTTKEDRIYSVRTIVEDNDGNLWFGSRGGLLFCYNPSAKLNKDAKYFTDFTDKISKQVNKLQSGK
ncbi:MAG: hypothetical protein IAF38_21610 [Bacteroidia bacterium]|nr:hypothetical protein [Bacteroidia bacterium]